MRCVRPVFVTILILSLASPLLAQQKQVIPHAQDKPPGPPLSPREAMRKMTLPEGFTVELVASEPDIVNPVAMTFDEKGRTWITESLEYPRASAGRGRDRVKVLEDTDGDGQADKFTIFAEGLNIPSGIAVGHGGVWVANAPDILFLQDTDGDLKADKSEVIVTGFGRDDTHELPNSLTWGPDGWLYGLNGVFNRSHIHYSKTNPNYKAEHPGWQFTCAMFRIHPRTREFQVFCEGTSNPWGIAFDNEGSAFVSACVIDHLWHLVETGYYHRQGGPYPPFTWKIESIVDHKHQKAAYCGIHYFDSDAYPPEYRGKLYMGNIHGNCINVDKLRRNASTYLSSGEPDFLSANDAWFMPIVQKTGPDGCLYILDWYDRYHCYQDARRDPQGIDRLKGRLYRIRYQDTPRAPKFDLSQESDEQLIERLNSPNGLFRDLAQRLLAERNTAAIATKLLEVINKPNTPEKRRRQAWFALQGCDLVQHKLHWEVPRKFANHADPFYRAWAIRCLGTHAIQEIAAPDGSEVLEQPAAELLMPALEDESPAVRLQAVIVVGQLARRNRTYVSYAEPLAKCVVQSNDPLLPRIVWQSLKPYLERHPAEALAFLKTDGLIASPAGQEFVPRIAEWLLARQPFDPRPVAQVLELVTHGPTPQPRSAGEILRQLTLRVQNREIAGVQLAGLRKAVEPLLAKVLSGSSDQPLYLDAALLAASWQDAHGVAAVRNALQAANAPEPRRLEALSALIAAQDPQVLEVIDLILARRDSSPEFRGQVLAALGRLDSPIIGQMVLSNYQRMEPGLQPKAIELLTQRVGWSKQLLAAIARKDIPPNVLNLNQARRLMETRDPDIVRQIGETWGTLRDTRNPERERVIAEMKQFIRRTPGDPRAGEAVFKRICAQCHKIYGEGTEVGPDITVNGRASFDQLLSNVFDPSLVIGAAYRAYSLITADGRVLTGLLVEDSEQRVVLKVQGGKLETVARKDVDELRASEISLMPEQLEKQLKPREIADLFAYLTLDKPPSDPQARRLPGVIEPKPRQTQDPKEFAGIIGEVAPGFTTAACGENGVALLKEHRGREVVVKTHPVDRQTPCVLSGRFTLPEGKASRLLLDVSHDPRGDWRLVVRANGETLLDRIIGKQTADNGWAELSVDLSKFAGRRVRLELQNAANDWNYEFGYWGRAVIVSE